MRPSRQSIKGRLFGWPTDVGFFVVEVFKDMYGLTLMESLACMKSRSFKATSKSVIDFNLVVLTPRSFRIGSITWIENLA